MSGNGRAWETKSHTFGNEEALVDAVLTRRVGETLNVTHSSSVYLFLPNKTRIAERTQGCYHVPPQYFLTQCVDVWQSWSILKYRESISSQDRVEFLLCPFLHIGV
jgi:hypothetical protein